MEEVEGAGVGPVQHIKIDSNGRYLLIVKGSMGGAQFDRLSDELSAWWASDKRIALLALPSGVEVVIERVDGGRGV